MDTDTDNRIVGMYVHQHWPYNHPYCARTWTIEDWRGYAEGLRRLGYNTILFWPILEIIPDPPTPSDIAYLHKSARLVTLLHDMGMRVYIALCPNVVPVDAEAVRAPIERRHFFYCDRRVNPADPDDMADMLRRREFLLGKLREVDGVSIIDSDPGGYPGSTNEEFVNLLLEHRRLLDKLRRGIELIYWMHAGWRGYGRFYETGVLTFSTDEENLEVLSMLKEASPEPWGLANGLQLAERLGIAEKVISFNYGRIEGEPSFPMTNFGGTSAWEGGAAPGPRGVMGNAQTHCVQLPNTFAFARGAQGLPITEDDYVAFAEDLVPGVGRTIVDGWKALAGEDPAAMRHQAEVLDAVPDETLQPGPLGGLLFGSPRRFLTDLALMLRMRASYCALRAVDGRPDPTLVRAFAEDSSAWQAVHGYENTWWWPDLDDVLRRIGSAEIDAVQATVMNPFKTPRLEPGETPFEYVARSLRLAESHTPRLLAALRTAAKNL